MSVQWHWLLGGWYPRGLIHHNFLLRYVLTNIYHCCVLWAHSYEVKKNYFVGLTEIILKNNRRNINEYLYVKNDNKVNNVYTCNCRTINQICYKVTSLCHSSRDYSGRCCCEDILKKPKCKSVSCHTGQSKSMVADKSIAITITKGKAKQPVKHTRDN